MTWRPENTGRATRRVLANQRRGGETATAGRGLRQFGPAIWIADGQPVSFLGFPYPTRMAVMKLIEGGLFCCWSPIMLSAALKLELDALGPVRFVVFPSRLHHLFIADLGVRLP